MNTMKVAMNTLFGATTLWRVMHGASWMHMATRVRMEVSGAIVLLHTLFD